jgi:hypothetical protein
MYSVPNQNTIPLNVLGSKEARSRLTALEQHEQVEQNKATAAQLSKALGYLPPGIGETISSEMYKHCFIYADVKKRLKQPSIF